MVHLTDQLGIANGECVKRTVRHDDSVIDATRLVTVIIKDTTGEFERSARRRAAVSRGSGDGCALAGCRVTEGVDDRYAGARRVRDGIGHDAARELVVSRREGNGKLAAAAAVALGGTPGTWTGAPTQPHVVGLEEALCLQPVEVELCLVAGDTNRLRCLVATDGLILGADKAIQLATHGIGQHADACNAPVEVSHSCTFLTDRCLDDRRC